jgi:cyclophilin family peptidyl-prolyl cis-trans isomerase
MKKKIWILIIILLIVLVGGFFMIQSLDSGTIAIIETNYGNIKLKLYDEKTPITTNNFIKLSNEGFYNNLTFHRVIPGFVIQGGCPNGDGTGDPGYTIVDEIDSSLTHNEVGMLSMANEGPNTGGSQFFITLKPQPYLNGKHTVFGKVIDGLDVVEAIGNVPTGAMGKPLNPVIIQRIRIQ